MIAQKVVQLVLTQFFLHAHALPQFSSKQLESWKVMSDPPCPNIAFDQPSPLLETCELRVKYYRNSTSSMQNIPSTTASTLKLPAIRQGRKYGYRAKRPSESNQLGYCSAGLAVYPPMAGPMESPIAYESGRRANALGRVSTDVVLDDNHYTRLQG